MNKLIQLSPTEYVRAADVKGVQAVVAGKSVSVTLIDGTSRVVGAADPIAMAATLVATINAALV